MNEFADNFQVELFSDEIDYDDYYVNSSISEKKDCIFIPCGYGKTDKGFYIHGIERTNNIEQSEIDIFALVYNYLTRNAQMSKKDVPTCLKVLDIDHNIDFNYKSIYRLAIVFLQMIRHGYLKNGVLDISYTENENNLKCAVYAINFYANLFSRLTGGISVKLRINMTGNGKKVGLDSSNDIYVSDVEHWTSNAREIWYGRKIRYHLNKDNINDLEYLLHEISPYDRFKEGQFEIICSMLNANEHCACIMPTGSGKSLIFYFLSILQPLPIYIISPTDILIKDQIRNLKDIHRIDDVCHLRLIGGRQFQRFEAHNKMIYMTPTTLQNRDMLAAFHNINNGTRTVDSHVERLSHGALASFVVLDELHCLSNWGHDFRPEYMMLSRNLTQLLDNVCFCGFTATADYTVVKDIQKQLNIPDTNFYSPITFEKYNISYKYYCCKDMSDMMNRLCAMIGQLLEREERTIIFTKNVKISEKLSDAIGPKADVFWPDSPSSYYSFLKGNCSILIASQELGVGINFPNVKNIIHYGLPLSKNAYIQEIGRAGRANEHVNSYVFFLKDTSKNVPAELLQRNTPISRVPDLIKGIKGDFADTYRILTDDCPSKDDMIEDVLEFSKSFDYKIRAIEERKYPPGELKGIRRKLYMLYLTGYIADWYHYEVDEKTGMTGVLINICSTNTNMYRLHPEKMLQRMKSKMTNYFEMMGVESREAIVKINKATSPENIISAYIEWYYQKYLYHNNEEFLDMYDLIVVGAEKRDDEITDNIRDYFVLPFTKLRDDEIYFDSLSTKEVINKAVMGVGRDTLVNVERLLSSKYNCHLDIILFFGNLVRNDNLDEYRLERIIQNMDLQEKQDVYNALYQIYEKCSMRGRLSLINYVSKDSRRLNADVESYIDTVYKLVPRDAIYYGIALRKINKIFMMKGM